MKKFLGFAGSSCYADGGALDLIGAFESEAEAIAACRAQQHLEWWHVLDAESGKIVAFYPGWYCGAMSEATHPGAVMWTGHGFVES